VEIEGVAVSWSPPEVPRGPQDSEGGSRWVLEFTAYNPGQLPVSDVRVAVQFALDVERVHYDGHLDPQTRTMPPVLAGGKERTWRRTLRMNYAASHAALRETTAVVSFADLEDPRTPPQHLAQTPATT
jgi:hypothetical protein